MSDAVLNVVLGLITSVVSGAVVWTWSRVTRSRLLHRKAAFFGLHPGEACLVILNSHWQTPKATSHNDVYAIIELAMLADEVGCPFSLAPANGSEANGDRTELGVGGLESNARNVEYVASYLPGVKVNSNTAKRHPSAFIAGGQRFALEKGREDHALVAKFTPAGSTRSVMVVMGQSSIANRAAVNYLKREYKTLAKSLASLDRFCLMLRVNSADTYGYQAVELVADLSAVAFQSVL